MPICIPTHMGMAVGTCGGSQEPPILACAYPPPGGGSAWVGTHSWVPPGSVSTTYFRPKMGSKTSKEHTQASGQVTTANLANHVPSASSHCANILDAVSHSLASWEEEWVTPGHSISECGPVVMYLVEQELKLLRILGRQLHPDDAVQLAQHLDAVKQTDGQTTLDAETEDLIVAMYIKSGASHVL